MSETISAKRIDETARLISDLERTGLLDREIEFLPDEVQIEERRNRKLGFTRPELAVILSYAKIDLYNGLIESEGDRPVSRTYDRDGLLVTEQQGGEVVRWQYDAFGRLSRRATSWGSKDTLSWNAQGVSGLIDPTGFQSVIVEDTFMGIPACARTARDGTT